MHKNSKPNPNIQKLAIRISVITLIALTVVSVFAYIRIGAMTRLLSLQTNHNTMAIKNLKKCFENKDDVCEDYKYYGNEATYKSILELSR